MRTATRVTMAALSLLLLPIDADAHANHGQAAGFLSGLGHPVAGLDHMLAMLAVGLWGAQLRAPAVWLLPVTFPLVMAVGGFLGLVGIPLPHVELAIALSALALGAAIAASWRPGLLVAAALVGWFALFHGHAHGTELPPGASGLAYSVGFVVATGLLHLAGIALGELHRWRLGVAALRAAGGAIMFAGTWFLARSLG